MGMGRASRLDGIRRMVISIGIAAGGVLAVQALAAGAEQPQLGHYDAVVTDPASAPSAAHAAPVPAAAELPRTGPSASLPLLGGSALLAAYGLRSGRRA